jgi:hypothetical protein
MKNNKLILGWEPVSTDHDRKEYVYFIKKDLKDRPLIKIGRSYDPKKRCFQIRMDESKHIKLLAEIEVINTKNSSSLEAYLHKYFKESRVEGEWFIENENILSFIEEVKNGKYL